MLPKIGHFVVHGIAVEISATTQLLQLYGKVAFSVLKTFFDNALGRFDDSRYDCSQADPAYYVTVTDGRGDPDRPAAALRAAERAVQAVADLQEPHAAADPGFVTISVGVASFHANTATTPAELIKTADEALYEAKRSGRNRANAG